MASSTSSGKYPHASISVRRSFLVEPSLMSVILPRPSDGRSLRRVRALVLAVADAVGVGVLRRSAADRPRERAGHDRVTLVRVLRVAFLHHQRVAPFDPRGEVIGEPPPQAGPHVERAEVAPRADRVEAAITATREAVQIPAAAAQRRDQQVARHARVIHVAAARGVHRGGRHSGAELDAEQPVELVSDAAAEVGAVLRAHVARAVHDDGITEERFARVTGDLEMAAFWSGGCRDGARKRGQRDHARDPDPQGAGKPAA